MVMPLTSSDDRRAGGAVPSPATPDEDTARLVACEGAVGILVGCQDNPGYALPGSSMPFRKAHVTSGVKVGRYGQ